MKIKSSIFAVFLSLSLIVSQAIAYQPINPNGQATSANSSPVALSAPLGITASSFIAPQSTAYSVGQMIANSATAGSVTPLSFAIAPGNGIPVYLIGGLLQQQNNATAGPSTVQGTNVTVRLHIYGQSPTVGASSGDGKTFSTTMVNYCGSMDATLFQQGSDWTVGILTPSPGEGSFIACAPAGGSSTVYGLVQAQSAFTPATASMVYQITLWKQ